MLIVGLVIVCMLVVLCKCVSMLGVCVLLSGIFCSVIMFVLSLLIMVVIWLIVCVGYVL